ncbi:NAD(P)H-binding protein [Pedobacter sp. UYP1]|uniref:NAD(P)H-binding protein n=1 Tax=Pedobacter sp. UYP1 TaxID=1756396 RepID=UPI001E742FEE|nr:hypothetical protein [Pedobacter cryoconitis]
MKIAIAAATGNIGSRVAVQISSGGGTPILLGQRLDRLNQLEINNSISRVVDLSHPEQMIQATKDADALLWLVPPVLTVPSLKEWYHKVTMAGIAAVREHKIKRVVLISSLGAGAADDLGTVSYAGDMEIAFDKLNTNVLALRPGYFMENILMQAESIKSGNEFAFTYEADHDIPWISTDDIGDTAAKFLLDNTWAGRWKLNLMGPENLNAEEVALRLSRLLGKKITYRQKSILNASAELESFGANVTVSKELSALFKALGDPSGVYSTPRTHEAFTPTSFDQFISTKLAPFFS